MSDVLAVSSARLPGHAREQPARQAHVRIQLLKGFQLTAGGEPVPLPGGAERLLALLSLNERPLRRNSVAGILWADATEERASGNLRTMIWRSRRPGLDLVESDGAALRLAPGVAVDVREMSSQAERLLGAGRCLDADYDDSTLTGDLLPFWDDDWVVIDRERLRQLRLHALERLCGGAHRRGTRARGNPPRPVGGASRATTGKRPPGGDHGSPQRGQPGRG